MKTTNDLRTLLRVSLIVLLLGCTTSCITTHVISNQHSDNIDNEECQSVSHWKYWWGLGGPDEILVGPNSEDTVCPCTNKAMASVKVKSSFGDYLLTAITLGIVNHRTVSFECAEVDNGEQER